jgi:hypothetical protein
MHRIPSARALALICAAVSCIAAPAGAQTRPAHPAAKAAPAAGPKRIGVFDDWTAVTHQEAGQTVCYAFTRASTSTPKIPGRGDVVMTVTQRPNLRDSVAISEGFTFGQGIDVTVQADQAALAFYTHDRSAFARDGHAAVAAFGQARQAIARGPGPHKEQVADTFSLRGFAAAYAVINKTCPGPAPKG